MYFIVGVLNFSNDQYFDGFWSDFRAAVAAVILLIIKPLHNASCWNL